MRTVYYAHTMYMFGTGPENRELARMRRQFRRSVIVNPADHQHRPEKRRNNLAFCFKLVRQCDTVVFSRLLRKVTTGVGKEVNYALKIAKVVFELRRSGFKRRNQPVNYLSREESRKLGRKWRSANHEV